VPTGTLLLNADAFYISGVPYFAGTPRLLLFYSKACARYDVRGRRPNWESPSAIGCDQAHEP
jgi:hypothetical protein